MSAVCPLTASSWRPAASTTTGVLQPRKLGRGVRQRISPVRLSTPTMQASLSASQFWITRSPTITGDAAVPQGPSNVPRSRDQSGLPSSEKPCSPPRPKKATTTSPSVAQVAEA